MIKIDTDTVRDSGKDLKNLNNKLSEEIETLKKRISGITDATNEWEGLSAKRFVASSVEELNQLSSIITLINTYADELVIEADSYQSSIFSTRP